jgi:autophagy-related protein 18
MLYSSPLIALVGAGARPGDSTRRLRLWNMQTDASVCELNFSSSILAVRMNHARLLVVLELRVHIFELSSMRLLHTLETVPNRLGLVDMCADSERCHVVLLGAGVGQVLLFDALQLHSVSTLQARKSALSLLAISPCGLLIASASDRGTVVNVHSFPQGQLLHAFRRGAMTATIFHLAFSTAAASIDGGADPDNLLIRAASSSLGVPVGVLDKCSGQSACRPAVPSPSPPACSQMLCAVASSGTVHVWSLHAQRGAVHGGKGNKEVAAGFALISGERAFAHAKLPAGTRATAALRPAAPYSGGHVQEMALLLVTEKGNFYHYRLDSVRGGECVLLDERRVGLNCQ